MVALEDVEYERLVVETAGASILCLDERLQIERILVDRRMVLIATGRGVRNGGLEGLCLPELVCPGGAGEVRVQTEFRQTELRRRELAGGVAARNR